MWCGWKWHFWGRCLRKEQFIVLFLLWEGWEGALADTHTECQRGCCRALSASVIKRMLPKIPWDDEFRYDPTPSACPNTGSCHWGSREHKECARGARASWNISGNLAFGVCFPHLSDSQERAVSKRASGRTDPAHILEFWLSQNDCEVSSQRGKIYKELNLGKMRLLRGMKAELGRGSCRL